MGRNRPQVRDDERMRMLRRGTQLRHKLRRYEKWMPRDLYNARLSTLIPTADLQARVLKLLLIGAVRLVIAAVFFDDFPFVKDRGCNGVILDHNLQPASKPATRGGDYKVSGRAAVLFGFGIFEPQYIACIL
jgi:hypothetical protein